ncbi:RES family NAD+ phosphorylase [Sphingomonas sp.]|uniref:RES family NAD+ phosphorylase n=1 Tax=Sphingomonas sp. TaxID=28214 RepID=UPI0025DC4C5D|nr:RES family NAD+ phosphorylase [Sphingomonas sp.]
MERRRALDDRLLDLVGAIEGQSFDGTMWRVVRQGRDVLDGSRGSGRWNTADMSVLYGAAERDGALAEINFHLSRGQSVFPSRMRHDVFELAVKARQTLVLADMAQLKALGVEDSRYREMLYDRTQEIGAAAAFLGFDGLIVPSARWACQNIVLFLDAINLEEVRTVSSEPVDWQTWRRANV